MLPDHMTPEPPAPARFDPQQNLWVFSRYADVAAALREPQLWPVSGKYEDRDAAGRLQVRPAMLDALGPGQLQRWQSGAYRLAADALDRLPQDGAVDILADFAKPWCLSVAMLATGAPEGERERLGELGERVFAATGEPEDSPLRPAAAEATAELERFFEKGPIPMGEPSFIAISQTAARLLTNSWLALVLHPGELERLRSNPALMPGAVEEFLRYSGIVRRIYRRATAPLEFKGVSIPADGRIALMLASANRDPDVFPDPNRFQITRSAEGQLALGAGRNSCVGAGVIRMMFAAATSALVRKFQAAELKQIGAWKVGSGFCFPTAVHVLFQPAKPVETAFDTNFTFRR